MDTLTVIRQVVDLAAERDSLRDQLQISSEVIFSYQTTNKELRERCATQEELIDELREAITKLRAELDGAKAVTESSVLDMRKRVAELDTASASEQAHMTRDEILSVAWKALLEKRHVRAIMEDGKGSSVCYMTDISDIDTSGMPIRFVQIVDSDGSHWAYLAIERADGETFPMLSRLEIV